ncbi:MAG: LysR family transcriptional regulator [Bacillota bacterium]|nr:LysR family transcriptional regulator [Bacillota bacterium]MDW7677234.1 LysR family transcriptional regulator [Bacillota bacterium]
MTLQQLRYFTKMAGILHYTQAAEQLNVSQPSLSYALSELSKELGVPLFKKKGKKISLTEFGEAFLPYVESALGILDQGEAQLAIMNQPTEGIINLGYIYSVSFDAIPHLIDEFYIHQGNRNIHFTFQVNMTNTLIEKLMDCTLDVVMAPQPEVVAEGIEAIPVFQQELYLMVYNDHPLATRTSVTFDDFKDEKFVMINKKTDLYVQTEALFKKHNLVPDTAFKVDECNSMAAFVGSQLGVAIMPQIPSLDNYKVTAIPFEGRPWSRTICLLWNTKCRSNPILRSFINYFTSHDKQKTLPSI